MTKLFDTQCVILSTAAQHKMGLARAPKTLPAAQARGLNERGVPTPRGGVTWTHMTVARVLARASGCPC